LTPQSEQTWLWLSGRTSGEKINEKPRDPGLKPLAWDRCYDFKNIFAKKIGEKIYVLDSKQS
jgi:hypothetical protein